jgi:hypothetical protein
MELLDAVDRRHLLRMLEKLEARLAKRAVSGTRSAEP